MRHHSLGKYFMTRPDSDGRHELLAKHWFGFCGMRVSGEERREPLVTEHGEKGLAKGLLLLVSGYIAEVASIT
jgi:hypothetical protein